MADILRPPDGPKVWVEPEPMAEMVAEWQTITTQLTAELSRALGFALAFMVPGDPDEPLWFDAMRYDPDASEEWTP